MTSVKKIESCEKPDSCFEKHQADLLYLHNSNEDHFNGNKKSTKFCEILNESDAQILHDSNDCDNIVVKLSFNIVNPCVTYFLSIVSYFCSFNVIIVRFENVGKDIKIEGQLDGIFEMIVECKSSKKQVLKAFEAIYHNEPIQKIGIEKVVDGNLETPWFPRHISDIDKCMHVVTKYEPTEDPKHPGYQDQVYIDRRAELNRVANSYKYGDKIPHVDYTEGEHKLWGVCYETLKKLMNSYCCKEYRENIKMLEDEGIIKADKIPQIADLSVYLRSKTGFQLRPCGGLLSARDFLASLAFRVFQTTQYTRHPKAPHHSPEPDVIHEILGHVPMFADPYIAQISQEIGLLSLGAKDDQIEKLSTIYWFIIEFGLCQENGKLKAIGAGLISAYGELLHACAETTSHQPFVPEVTAVTKYDDSHYQPVYFVTESLKDAFIKVKKYAKSFKKPFITTYNPYIDTVQVTMRKDAIENKKANISIMIEELHDLFAN
uniref:BH4_AAA_HYDROXYL_2 domain-containing protein n=1 Tax=Rhabditophanes sp. KR3021 TaxID=114890 RepID=A0AC35U4N2_9BILA